MGIRRSLVAVVGLSLFGAQALATPLTLQEREWALIDRPVKEIVLDLVMPVILREGRPAQLNLLSRSEARLESIIRNLPEELTEEIVVAVSVYAQAISILRLSEPLHEIAKTRTSAVIDTQNRRTLAIMAQTGVLALIGFGNLAMYPYLEGSELILSTALGVAFIVGSHVRLYIQVARVREEVTRPVQIQNRLVYLRSNPEIATLQDTKTLEILGPLRDRAEPLIYDPRSLLCEVAFTKREP